MSVPSWVSQYVGLPFCEKNADKQTGYDCYTFAKLVLFEQCRIAIPDYMASYANSHDRQAIKDTFYFTLDVRGQQANYTDAEVAERGWERLERQWIKIDEPYQEFDLAFFSLFGSIHCGIIIDAEFLLHVLKGTDACLARYRSLLWRNRHRGTYRHESLRPR